MAEISLHKRQRIRLYLLNYVIVLFLSNIICLQLCKMFYRGQLYELYFQILDHKQSRRPSKISHQIYATAWFMLDLWLTGDHFVGKCLLWVNQLGGLPCLCSHPSLLYFEQLGEKWTKFNNFWCSESWGNFTSENCKLTHLAWSLLPHYLVKCKVALFEVYCITVIII